MKSRWTTLKNQMKAVLPQTQVWRPRHWELFFEVEGSATDASVADLHTTGPESKEPPR